MAKQDEKKVDEVKEEKPVADKSTIIPEEKKPEDVVEVKNDAPKADEKVADKTPEKIEQPKDDELDVQDGRRLDQNVEAAAFDEKEEKKLAHAKAPEEPEHVKNAQKNPNGIGSEWPR